MPPRTLDEAAIRPHPDFEQLRKALLQDGKPDYIPFYELFANVEIMEAVLGGKVADRASVVEFYYRTGYDYVPCGPWVDMALGDVIDRSKGNYPISDWKTFEEYRWPPHDSINFGEYEAVGRILPEGMEIIAQTGGIFEMAQKLVGYEQLCYMLADDPPLVEALFERMGALYEAMYRGMASFAQVGAVVISDDLGFKTQTLIGVKDMRKYVLPWHKRLAEIIHAAGKPCILHSCGQLAEIMEDVIHDVRIDAKHSYEDAILPVTEAKKLYGDRIAILGGFDVDRLCRSTEEEIRAHTRMLVAECGADGGYALGSGNSIAKFVPVENYLTMLDEGWRMRG